MNTHQQALLGTPTVNSFVLPTLSPQERSRLTFQHHALGLGLEKPFLAPCVRPTTILDIGCGSGAWAAEMGKIFPEASITGMDLRMPICPQSPLFQFVPGGTLSSLPFRDVSFEYTHQRCLGTVIPSVHWQSIVGECTRVTCLGGWLELWEHGLPTNIGPKTVQFYRWWQDALASQGIDLKIAERLGQLLQNTGGLEHVTQETFSLPLYGERRAEEAMRTNLLATIHGTKTRILALGIQEKDFDEVADALPQEWQACQTRHQFHVAYGQRKSHRTLLSAVDRSLAQRPLNLRPAHLVRQPLRCSV